MSNKYAKTGWKKYEYPPNMIQEEEKEKNMKLTKYQMASMLKARIANKIAVSARKGDMTTEAEWKAWLVRMENKTLKERLNEEFIQEFILWLQGKSMYNVEEFSKIIYNEEGQVVNRKTVEGTPWGNKPLFACKGVTEFLDQGIDRREAVITYLTKLKMRKPSNINECYLYFKYLVRGVALDENGCHEVESMAPYDYPLGPQGTVVGPGKTPPVPPPYNGGGYRQLFTDAEEVARVDPEVFFEWIENGGPPTRFAPGGGGAPEDDPEWEATVMYGTATSYDPSTDPDNPDAPGRVNFLQWSLIMPEDQDYLLSTAYARSAATAASGSNQYGNAPTGVPNVAPTGTVNRNSQNAMGAQQLKSLISAITQQAGKTRDAINAQGKNTADALASVKHRLDAIAANGGTPVTTIQFQNVPQPVGDSRQAMSHNVITQVLADQTDAISKLAASVSNLDHPSDLYDEWSEDLKKKMTALDSRMEKIVRDANASQLKKMQAATKSLNETTLAKINELSTHISNQDLANIAAQRTITAVNKQYEDLLTQIGLTKAETSNLISGIPGKVDESIKKLQTLVDTGKLDKQTFTTVATHAQDLRNTVSQALNEWVPPVAQAHVDEKLVNTIINNVLNRTGQASATPPASSPEQIQQMTTHINQLTSDHNLALQQLNSAQLMIQQYEAALNQAGNSSAQVQQLQQGLQQASGERARLANELASTGITVNALKTELDAARTYARSAEAQAKQLQDELQKNQRTATEAQTQLQKLQDELANAQKNAQLKDVAFKDVSENKNEEVLRAKEAMSQAQIEAGEARSQLTNTNRELARIAAEKERLEKTLQKTEEERVQLSAKLSSTVHQAQSLATSGRVSPEHVAARVQEMLQANPPRAHDNSLTVYAIAKDLATAIANKDPKKAFDMIQNSTMALHMSANKVYPLLTNEAMQTISGSMGGIVRGAVESYDRNHDDFSAIEAKTAEGAVASLMVLFNAEHAAAGSRIQLNQRMQQQIENANAGANSAHAQKGEADAEIFRLQEELKKMKQTIEELETQKSAAPIPEAAPELGVEEALSAARFQLHAEKEKRNLIPVELSPAKAKAAALAKEREDPSLEKHVEEITKETEQQPITQMPLLIADAAEPVPVPPFLQAIRDRSEKNKHLFKSRGKNPIAPTAIIRQRLDATVELKEKLGDRVTLVSDALSTFLDGFAGFAGKSLPEVGTIVSDLFQQGRTQEANQGVGYISVRTLYEQIYPAFHTFVSEDKRQSAYKTMHLTEWAGLTEEAKVMTLGAWLDRSDSRNKELSLNLEKREAYDLEAVKVIDAAINGSVAEQWLRTYEAKVARGTVLNADQAYEALIAAKKRGDPFFSHLEDRSTTEATKGKPLLTDLVNMEMALGLREGVARIVEIYTKTEAFMRSPNEDEFTNRKGLGPSGEWIHEKNISSAGTYETTLEAALDLYSRYMFSKDGNIGMAILAGVQTGTYGASANQLELEAAAIRATLVGMTRKYAEEWKTVVGPHHPLVQALGMGDINTMARFLHHSVPNGDFGAPTLSDISPDVANRVHLNQMMMERVYYNHALALTTKLDPEFTPELIGPMFAETIAGLNIRVEEAYSPQGTGAKAVKSLQDSAYLTALGISTLANLETSGQNDYKTVAKIAHNAEDVVMQTLVRQGDILNDLTDKLDSMKGKAVDEYTKQLNKYEAELSDHIRDIARRASTATMLTRQLHYEHELFVFDKLGETQDPRHIAAARQMAAGMGAIFANSPGLVSAISKEGVDSAIALMAAKVLKQTLSVGGFPVASREMAAYAGNMVEKQSSSKANYLRNSIIQDFDELEDGVMARNATRLYAFKHPLHMDDD